MYISWFKLGYTVPVTLTLSYGEEIYICVFEIPQTGVLLLKLRLQDEISGLIVISTEET